MTAPDVQEYVVEPELAALGATLPLLCDFVVATDDTTILDPHVNVGLVAGDGGAILWPMLMGLNRGKEFLLTGDRMDADEALRLGLVNHVYPRDELHDAAAALAARLAAGPQVALQFNKRLANAELVDRVNRVLPDGMTLRRLLERGRVPA